MLAFVLVLCLGFYVSVNQNQENVSQNQEKDEKKSLLAKKLELNADQEASMLEIFDRCGIGEIARVQTIQQGDESTSYWLDDSETVVYRNFDYRIVVYVNNNTKELESIYFHNNEIYIEGNVVSQITDYYVNSDDRNTYKATSQVMIKSLLNYPDTAEFPSISGWTFAVEDGIVIIQSSVTTTNAFNVKSTLNFQIKAKNDDIFSLILDGTEYIQHN